MPIQTSYLDCSEYNRVSTDTGTDLGTVAVDKANLGEPLLNET